jgi:hypothetical protein
MNSKILGLLAIGVLACVNSQAESVVIDGVFSGFVDAGGTGMIGSLNASSVAAGTPIFGTSSYNAQIFPVNSSSGGEGLYVALGSATPATITEFVDGRSFTVSGNVQSVLDVFSLPTQDPNNHLYLETMNYGASVSSGGFSGAIDLNLSNYLGAPFASNVNNPGSVAFANQNGLGVSQEDTLQALSSQGNNTGSLYFSISHAWAGPVRFAAPEIDPAPAAGGVALLLGGLVVLRGRRSIGTEEK